MFTSLKTKIILFSAVLTIIIITFQYIPQKESEKKLDQHSQENLKNIGEIVYKVVINDLSKDLTDTELKSKLKNEFLNIKIGIDGFPFILNSEGTFIIHPKAENLNWSDKGFVKTMMKNKNGFIRYTSPKTGTDKYVSYKYCKDRDWIIAVSMWANEYEELTDYSQAMMQYSVITAVIFLSLFFIYILRSIVSPILSLTKTSTKISEGDYNSEINIERNDELGKLSKSLKSMVNSIIQNMNDANSQAKKAKEAEKEAQNFNEIITKEQHKLTEATLELKSAMELVSDGNLTKNVNSRNKEANLKILFDAYNQSIENINSMFRKLKNAIHSTIDLTKEISINTDKIATNKNLENNQITDVASAVEEISQTILQTSQNSTSAHESAEKAKEEALFGVNKVNESKQSMEVLAESSLNAANVISSLANKTDQIGEVANVIKEIADQTNLLALNAAIEAARAGEQGRGFAVVADEVRKLAERTTSATKEIAETISSVQKEAKSANEVMNNSKVNVEKGLELSKGVEEVLNSILANVNQVAEQISNVANASEEESAAVEEISKNLEEINNLSVNNTEAINGIATSTSQLSDLNKELEIVISHFKIKENDEEKIFQSRSIKKEVVFS